MNEGDGDGDGRMMTMMMIVPLGIQIHTTYEVRPYYQQRLLESMMPQMWLEWAQQ